MLAIGIIQESNSAWSSPTVLVKKKDGTTRFCIDYRRLNQATKVDAYPLPHIEDSLNTLGGARFFCSLDLASGYWQVEMDAADREKTAFVTQGGLYEFRVMPFGLVNAPATFERLMERVLSGIAWSECLVYLDDILVFGPDFGTTLARLEKVLDRLGEAGLKLKGKLAHSLMISNLVLISCHADIVRTFIREENAKINLISFYREKKRKLWKCWIFSFPNQSLYYVIRGEFPRN